MQTPSKISIYRNYTKNYAPLPQVALAQQSIMVYLRQTLPTRVSQATKGESCRAEAIQSNDMEAQQALEELCQPSARAGRTAL